MSSRNLAPAYTEPQVHASVHHTCDELQRPTHACITCVCGRMWERHGVGLVAQQVECMVKQSEATAQALVVVAAAPTGDGRTSPYCSGSAPSKALPHVSILIRVCVLKQRRLISILHRTHAFEHHHTFPRCSGSMPLALPSHLTPSPQSTASAG
eukprot:1141673-Pelagomonas_calceolata.AAC.2